MSPSIGIGYGIRTGGDGAAPTIHYTYYTGSRQGRRTAAARRRAGMLWACFRYGRIEQAAHAVVQAQVDIADGLGGVDDLAGVP